MPSREHVLDDAAAAFAAGAYDTSLSLAREGLRADADDLELLRLAGRSGTELGTRDTLAHLEAVAERTPDDSVAWLDLGFGRAATGDAAGAADAFGRAVALAPDDREAPVHFAHAAHAAGRVDEALEAMLHVAHHAGAAPAVLRSTIALARSGGRLPVALAVAARLAAHDAADAGDSLEVAEIHLEMEQFDEAAAVFAYLRRSDEGHETYAAHGQVEALIRGERWREALDAAISATLLDRHVLTTDVLALVTARLFGGGGATRPPGGTPCPSDSASSVPRTAACTRSSGPDGRRRAVGQVPVL